MLMCVRMLSVTLASHEELGQSCSAHTNPLQSFTISPIYAAALADRPDTHYAGMLQTYISPQQIPVCHCLEC